MCTATYHFKRHCINHLMQLACESMAIHQLAFHSFSLSLFSSRHEIRVTSTLTIPCHSRDWYSHDLARQMETDRLETDQLGEVTQSGCCCLTSSVVSCLVPEKLVSYLIRCLPRRRRRTGSRKANNFSPLHGASEAAVEKASMCVHVY